jgi:hypothetical protein
LSANTAQTRKHFIERSEFEFETFAVNVPARLPVHSRAHVSQQEREVASMLPQILKLQKEGAVTNSAIKYARRYDVIYLMMDSGQVKHESIYGTAAFKSLLASTI